MCPLLIRREGQKWPSPCVSIPSPFAGSREAIGTVVVFGVSLSTLFTLYVIPVFFAAIARRTTSPQAIERELEAGLRSGAPAAAE
mgnify:CR=1 FL=1